MALKRAACGHFYDHERYTICPQCGIDLNLKPTEHQMSDTPGHGGGKPRVFVGATRAVNKPGANEPGPTRPVHPKTPTPAKPAGAEPGATVGLMKKQKGIDPVVGWLVAVAGPHKGEDFRLRDGRNFIGRAPHMHVVLKGDASVSAEKHAIISYDLRHNDFKLLPGEGTQHVYLNDEAIHTPSDLNPYDALELGETKLLFLPFCGDQFQW